MKFGRLLFLALMTALMVASGGTDSVALAASGAADGVLDLTDWDYAQGGTVQLNGQWEFYWGLLLESADLPQATPDLLINVPSSWDRYDIAGERLSGQGHGTYRLRVKTSLPAGTMLGLRIHVFSSAYRLYIDQQPVAGNGKVASCAEEEVGEYRPQAVVFAVPSSEFDIIVQVSNYHHARGGFWYPMHLGSADAILQMHDRAVGWEAFLLGALVIMLLFFLAIYLLRRELKYALRFSCLCAGMAVSLDMVGQYNLLRLLPGLSLNVAIFIWYASLTWTVYLLLLFMHELYTSRFSTAVTRVYLRVAVGAQLLYMLTGPGFYTRFAPFSNLLEIVAILCTIIIVVIGMRKGHRDGRLNLLSIAIVLVAYVLDLLSWPSSIANVTGRLAYVGLFLFLWLQVLIQARRIKQFQEREAAAELSFLQAQIKPHFLYNTLNSFISISRYDVDKARALIYDFSQYLRRSFDFRDLSQFVPLKHELEMAQAYLKIEQARFEERIQVNFTVDADLDVRVPMLMLQPLVENAVIHGILPKPEGGRVDVSIIMQDRRLSFRISDDGVGMDCEQWHRPSGSVAKSGVGLINIDGRLRKLFGTGLQIANRTQGGTEIRWSIPLRQKG